jgi:hypothetical protein
MMKEKKEETIEISIQKMVKSKEDKDKTKTCTENAAEVETF